MDYNSLMSEWSGFSFFLTYIENVVGSRVFASLGIAVLLFMSFIIIGAAVSICERILFKVLSGLLGIKAAYFMLVYLTFPGTIIHELSHALFGVITGAKITEIVFFEKPSTGRLGHVSFIARGSSIARAIQFSLISCAPVVIGLVLSNIFYFRMLGAEYLSTKLILGYLIFSIICHMSMSTTDIKQYVKGSFLMIPLLWGLSYAIFCVI